MRRVSLVLIGAALLAGCSSTQNRGHYPSARDYPASAKTGQGSQARYRVCHNGRNELTLPESAVSAHLRHGDRFGACSRRSSDRDRNNGRGNGRGHGRGHGNGRG